MIFTPDITITNTPLPIDTTGQSINVGNFPATQPVSGTVTVANPGLTDTQLRATAVPVSGPLTDAQLRATAVPISGTVTVAGASSTTLATVTSYSVGTSVLTISASNAAKTKLVIYNETGTLFVKLGSAASASSYSMRLTANTVWELSGYAGVVTAIKLSGTTPVLVTEIGI
jgi:hypothetical protein